MLKGTESNKANQAYIRNIHTRGIAVKDRLYYQDDGGIYIGTAEGRLKEYSRGNAADNNIIDNSADIEINKANIATNTSEIESLKQTKADKCFAIAMSIAL